MSSFKNKGILLYSLSIKSQCPFSPILLILEIVPQKQSVGASECNAYQNIWLKYHSQEEGWNLNWNGILGEITQTR